MAQCVKPGGSLITLMFPLPKEPYEGGPPYGLTVELYEELLSSTFDCVFIKECESFANRAGQEKIGLWKRK